MNKFLLSAAVVGLVSAPIVANAGDAGKVYVGVHGEGLLSSEFDVTDSGASGTIDSDGLGFGGGVALGYNFTDDFRSEVELTARHDDVEGGGEYETLTTAINGYYDFNNSTAFAPYVGAGVGYTTDLNNSDADGAFSYQLMTGVNYKLNDNNTINLGYRYLTTDKLKYAEFDETVEYSTHAVEIGYRYTF